MLVDHEASERVIEAGEPIVLDIGGTLGGYGSDITRTLWVTGGDPSRGPDERFRHLFNVLHHAQAAGTAAVRPGVACESIEVEVQADYDDGALFGVSEAPPGYLEVRYTVTVESDAPEADVRRVLDEGDAHSPYLDIFSRGQTCVRSMRIVRPERAT